MSHYGLGRWPRQTLSGSWLVSSGLTQAPAASVGPSCPSVPPLKTARQQSPVATVAAPLQHAGPAPGCGHPCLSPLQLHHVGSPPSQQADWTAPTASRASFSCRSGSWRSAASSQVVHPPPQTPQCQAGQGGLQRLGPAARRTGPHFSHRPVRLCSAPQPCTPRRLSLPPGLGQGQCIGAKITLGP